MQTILKEIQDTVIQYAEIIAKMIKVDVEIVDSSLLRIAGTGSYHDAINANIEGEGSVYKEVLNTGKAQIIQNPGYHLLCHNCPKQLICVEKFEICTPILLEQETIGVIGLICFTEEQKQHLLAGFDIFCDFLNQIASFISAKAGEVREKRQILQITGLLQQVMENMDNGVIIIDGRGQIIQANSSAIKQLFLSKEKLPSISIESTGDTLLDYDEFKVNVDGQRHNLMGKMIPVKIKGLKYGNILIFDGLKKVKSGLYRMTSKIQRTTSGDIIGHSQEIHDLKDKIGKISCSPSSILITGESGTGKELFARAIHGEGDRWDKPFVAINCGAIPDTLLESELFGYVKGAFTGADSRGKIGKFELAHKGVLFLDEIGDMPLYLQVKLLRVLQDRKITRIGSNQEIQLDIRVIAATNKDLPNMIKEKKFREDLYYRLNVIPFNIKPLRSRTEDIPELFDFLIKKYANLFQKEFKAITPETMNVFLSYKWPGNVRELENTIEFMVNMMDKDGILNEKTLPQRIFLPNSDNNREMDVRVCKLTDMEKQMIIKALALFGSSTEGKKKAAQKLGIGIATLYRKLEYYGLSK